MTPDPYPMRAATRTEISGRSLKMLRPICEKCQGSDSPPGWWVNCTHDPYVTIQEVPEQVVNYEDAGDGRKKVAGIETIISFVPRPNWVSIAIAPQNNSGAGRLKAYRRGFKGFILPEELRSPAFPNGVAPRCQFLECYVGNPKVETPWGSYCRDWEAKIVGLDVRGVRREVGPWPHSQTIREKQLSEVVW